MILLDTHIWVWWVHGDPRLGEAYAQVIEDHRAEGLGVSVISCWEVAKLVEVGRLALPVSLREWMDAALGIDGLRLLDLTPAIAIASTQLPGTFHRDPADQMIVATARTQGIPFVTADSKIRAYPHVDCLP